MSYHFVNVIIVLFIFNIFQMPFPNLSITGKEHVDNFTAANITWKKEGMKVRNKANVHR